MANSQIYISTLGQLDDIENLAAQKFDNLIEVLQIRKKELIAEIKRLRNEISAEELERKDSLNKIDKIQGHLDTVTDNKFITLSDKLQSEIESKREEISEKGYISIKYICNTSDIEEKISNLGRIVRESQPRYSLSMTPSVTMEQTKHSCCNFNKPTGVCISEEQRLIYIIDNGNRRINIFSMDCKFIRAFEDKKWKDPWDIAVDKNNLYMTDMAGHSILRYNCTPFLHFIKNVSDLGINQDQNHPIHKIKPQGITVYENNGDVYVTDINNSNVKVYSLDLEFKRAFGSNSLHHPVDVKIHGDNVYVLDNNKPNMHVFNMNGIPMKDIYFLNGSTPIETPLFFNIDCAGNFLVSNWRQDAVNILQSDGDVRYTIESNVQSGSVLKTPRGVAVTRSGKVVIVSDTPKNWIQIY